MAYALDKTGTLAANKIPSELIAVPGRIINTAVVPKESLFYRKGLVIRTGVGNTGTLLKEGVDYTLVFPCTTLAAFWGRIAYGGIYFLNKKYPNIYVTYQCVGDVYARGAKALKVNLSSPVECMQKTWESVIDVPEPSKADLTLHRDAGTMANLMTSIDGAVTRINQLGRV